MGKCKWLFLWKWIGRKKVRNYNSTIPHSALENAILNYIKKYYSKATVKDIVLCKTTDPKVIAARQFFEQGLGEPQNNIQIAKYAGYSDNDIERFSNCFNEELTPTIDQVLEAVYFSEISLSDLDEIITESGLSFYSLTTVEKGD